MISEWTRIQFPDVPEARLRELQETKLLFLGLERHEVEFGHNVELFDTVSVNVRELNERETGLIKAGPRASPNYWADFWHFNAERSKLTTWRLTAARGAVLSVFNFRMTLTYVQRNISTIPELAIPAAIQTITELSCQFDADFPSFVRSRLRHAATHSAEYAHAERWKHAMDGPYEADQIRVAEGAKGTFIQDAIVNQTYATADKGKMLSCEISLATKEKLQRIRRAVFGLFGPLQPDPTQRD